jgi:hypothetical protein
MPHGWEEEESADCAWDEKAEGKGKREARASASVGGGVTGEGTFGSGNGVDREREDVEKGIVRSKAFQQYENARWWRSLNRLMACVGIAVCIAIVVLAVVASRAAVGQ